MQGGPPFSSKRSLNPRSRGGKGRRLRDSSLAETFPSTTMPQTGSRWTCHSRGWTMGRSPARSSINASSFSNRRGSGKCCRTRSFPGVPNSPAHTGSRNSETMEAAHSSTLFTRWPPTLLHLRFRLFDEFPDLVMAQLEVADPIPYLLPQRGRNFLGLRHLLQGLDLVPAPILENPRQLDEQIPHFLHVDLLAEGGPVIGGRQSDLQRQACWSQSPAVAIPKQSKFPSALWMAWMISALPILAEFTPFSFAMARITWIFLLSSLLPSPEDRGAARIAAPRTTAGCSATSLCV